MRRLLIYIFASLVSLAGCGEEKDKIDVSTGTENEVDSETDPSDVQSPGTSLIDPDDISVQVQLPEICDDMANKCWERLSETAFVRHDILPAAEPDWADPEGVSGRLNDISFTMPEGMIGFQIHVQSPPVDGIEGSIYQVTSPSGKRMLKELTYLDDGTVFLGDIIGLENYPGNAFKNIHPDIVPYHTMFKFPLGSKQLSEDVGADGALESGRWTMSFFAYQRVSETVGKPIEADMDKFDIELYLQPQVSSTSHVLDIDIFLPAGLNLQQDSRKPPVIVDATIAPDSGFVAQRIDAFFELLSEKSGGVIRRGEVRYYDIPGTLTEVDGIRGLKLAGQATSVGRDGNHLRFVWTASILNSLPDDEDERLPVEGDDTPGDEELVAGGISSVLGFSMVKGLIASAIVADATYPPIETATIMFHEMGHFLGLGHTSHKLLIQSEKKTPTYGMIYDNYTETGTCLLEEFDLDTCEVEEANNLMFPKIFGFETRDVSVVPDQMAVILSAPIYRSTSQ